MSEYFNFYLGHKSNTEGNIVYSLAGPYFKDKDGNDKLRSLYSRSRSYIDNDIVDFFECIPVENMDPELLKMASFSIMGDDDSRVSIGYVMSFDVLEKNASSKPISGYLPLDEYESVIRENEDDVACYTPVLLSLEYYCGLSEAERQNYGYVSMVSTHSVQYVFNCIYEALSDIIGSSSYPEDEYCIILVKG
jgi:hypothetical protein